MSEHELDLRFADVFSNVTVLTDDGKIGLAGLPGLEWLEKFTHIQEEMSLRGLGFPNATSLGKRLAVPTPGVQSLGAKIRGLIPHGVPAKFTLFKYGRAKYLEPLLDAGTLRLLPASGYQDPSLNSAIHDDELSFESIDGSVRTRYVSLGDYYCFCSAWLHSDRLISDFEADAVLIVNEPLEFFTRLANALGRPDYDIQIKRVTYVDPLLVGKHRLTDLQFIKHMRFAYQAEHRLVIGPPSHVKRLDPLNITMGSIRDIAVLHGA